MLYVFLVLWAFDYATHYEDIPDHGLMLTKTGIEQIIIFEDKP